MCKTGNTLSPFLRQAWDQGDFTNLSKTAAEAATGAHISVIAHITREELTPLISDVDKFNGFANRFLWVCTYRSRVLPDGGTLDFDAPEVSELIDRFTRCLQAARARGRRVMERDAGASELWREIYRQLAEEVDGLAGAVTSRGEAQVLRLALLYAVLDGDTMVRVPHLKAAMAVWRYCKASARMLFFKKSRDSVEEKVFALLASAGEIGRTRTQLHAAFHNTVKAERLKAALKSLEGGGRAHRRAEPTEGRAAERWFVGPAATKEDELTKEEPNQDEAPVA